jgi:hypothetical protein
VVRKKSPTRSDRIQKSRRAIQGQKDKKTTFFEKMDFRKMDDVGRETSHQDRRNEKILTRKSLEKIDPGPKGGHEQEEDLRQQEG